MTTGWFYYDSPPEPEPGIELSGFLPDLRAAYESARFAISPVLGGTGQQIKIVEAMANGLPVIATRAAAGRSPIIHGENGLIAEDAEQFAEFVVQLWNDPGLCRRLGEAARETIRESFSRPRLLQSLSEILSPTSTSSKGVNVRAA